MAGAKGVLSVSQKLALSKAAPSKKALMKAAFLRQNDEERKKKRAQISAADKARMSQMPAAFGAKIRAGAGSAAANRASMMKGEKNPLDPMCPSPMPSLASDGKALPHTGLISIDFTVGQNQSALLICSNTGQSANVGVLVKVNADGTPAGAESLVIPTLSASDNGGGCTSIRAQKFAVSVVNCTNVMNRGGRITHINSSQRLGMLSSTSPQNYNDIINGIKSSPYRRRITADDLVVPKHLVGYPVDNGEYANFKQHHGATDALHFLESCCVVTESSAAPHGSHHAPRPMSVIAFIFDPVSTTQDYSVTVRAAYYTRWPLNTVPGSSMRPIPTAPQAVVNNYRNSAEAQANDMIHVAEGGAMAVALPRVMEFLGGAGRAAVNQVARHVAQVGAAGVVEEGAALAVL